MAEATTIKPDRVVSIHYLLKNDEGQELDSSQGDEPLTYLHGHGQIVPGLEEALDGVSEGEELEVSVPPERGYGEYDDEQVFTVPEEQFEFDVEEGQFIRAQLEDGRSWPFHVTSIQEGTVTLDGNHPLAGQNLNFSVKVVDIREASEEELNHGHAHTGEHHHG